MGHYHYKPLLWGKAAAVEGSEKKAFDIQIQKQRQKEPSLPPSEIRNESFYEGKGDKDILGAWERGTLVRWGKESGQDRGYDVSMQ